MAQNRLKKWAGGIAAIAALMFVAAPPASADNDTKSSGKGQVSAQRDTGWGR
jgi:hypothetical protein